MTDPHKLTAPVAKKLPHQRIHHGDTFIDDYSWLSEKENPEVTAYLRAQNEYTEQETAHIKPLQDAIFSEIKSRTQETDMSVPSRRGNYWYYSRTIEGKDYGVSCRCAVTGPDDWTPPEVATEVSVAGEEIIFDSNVEAEGSDFFSLGAFTISDDGTMLAYSTDVTGDERYTIRIKNLVTGELLDDVISDTAPGVVFALDGQYIFYHTVDSAWRPDTVWRHKIGDTGPDTKVFYEPDEKFWVGLGASRSKKYLMVWVGSKVTSEIFVLDTTDPDSEFTSVLGRREGVEYSVEHAVVGGDDYFYIVSNEGGPNSELLVAPTSDPRNVTVVAAHDPAVRIEDIDAFADHLVLSYRRNALPQISIASLDGIIDPAQVTFAERQFNDELYSVGLSSNPEFAAPTLRLGYTTFVTPSKLYELDVRTSKLTLLKEQPVLGDFDASTYREARVWVTARDGAQVPLSVIGRSDVVEAAQSGTPQPVLLYGYGSYEASMDPAFSVARLSALDRGALYVVAHVRGGGEMGRTWYDTGKALSKKNTFTDFIDAARWLIDQRYTSPEMMAAEGGSAGGLLMGAVANMAPELFTAILANVPFVDALTSILDPTLPLTVIEWDEWGDPLHDKAVYDYMKTYSPYENVKAKAYPSILAITSLNDTRVLYTEAAKWVARLQELSTSSNPILLKTEMKAGHGGVSGRYKKWHEIAYEFAWVLDRIGAR